MTKPQHKKLYLATQARPLCSTLTSKDSNGTEQTEQRARKWIDQRKYTRETPQFAWCMQLICLSKYLTKFIRGVKLSQHREKWFGNVYLFNKLNVSSHAIFELSSTSRKNKIITRPCNPVLIFLILHQLWVRDVVVPNLDLQLNEKYNQIVSHLMASKKKNLSDKHNYKEEFTNYLIKGCINWYIRFERSSPISYLLICHRVHVQKDYPLSTMYYRDSRSPDVYSHCAA